MADNIIVPESSPDTDNACSASIWNSCPEEALRRKATPGTWDFDDFTTFCATANRYTLVGDASPPAAAAAADTGIVVLNASGTDNNEAYMAYGINATGLAKVTGGGSNKIWFETRVKVSSIADQGVMLGLALPGYVAANMLTDDTGVPATSSGSFVGFRAVTADPDGMDAVYATASTALTVHQEAESSSKYVPGSSSVYLQNLIADTYVKFGLHFDGLKMWWYINGVRVNDSGVAYNVTNFPDAVNLTAFWGVKTGEAVAKTMTVDWWKAAYQI